jgi:hypothetical protein
MVEAISLNRNRHQIRQKRSRHILRPDNERRNKESRSINGVPETGIEKSPAWATQTRQMPIISLTMLPDPLRKRPTERGTLVSRLVNASSKRSTQILETRNL